MDLVLIVPVTSENSETLKRAIRDLTLAAATRSGGVFMTAIDRQ
jgi:hypothetical protein